MNNCLLLFFIFFMSCAAAPTKKATSKKFLVDPWDGKTDSKTIQSELTRGYDGLLSQNLFLVNAYFYSDALITAEVNERGKKNLESEAAIQADLREHKSTFSNDKTCFMVTVETPTIEEAKFKWWKAKLKDASGKLVDVNFANATRIDSIPRYDTSAGNYKWYNTSVACATKIDTSKQFSLILIPQVSDKKAAELTWEVAE